MPYRNQLALVVSALVAFDSLPAARGADLPKVQEAALLQIRVVEGDGAVHALGARSGRPLTVQISDETGRPDSGAAVSFRLPDEGPGGIFASGLKTEVVVTAADGRASVWGIQWNRVAGAFEIRVTTVKGQSRAGAVVSQYLSDAVTERPSDRASSAPGGRSRGKWFYAALLVTAGAAAGGAAIGLSRYSKTPAQPAAAAALTAPTSVGPPAITIGRP